MDSLEFSLFYSIFQLFSKCQAAVEEGQLYINIYSNEFFVSLTACTCLGSQSWTNRWTHWSLFDTLPHVDYCCKQHWHANCVLLLNKWWNWNWRRNKRKFTGIGSGAVWNVNKVSLSEKRDKKYWKKRVTWCNKQKSTKSKIIKNFSGF